jgi:hypothetical protein
MTIRRVPEITAEQQNARLEPLAEVPGSRMMMFRKDPVEPVPVGTLVARIFRVTGYDQDCDGSLMARLESIGADGEATGWTPTHLGLYPDSAWVIDSPDELDRLADLEAPGEPSA